MLKIKQLSDYCKSRLLDFSITEENTLVLGEKEYEIVDNEKLLFDTDFNFLPIPEYKVDGMVYEFGGRWYLQDCNETTSLQELKNIGKPVQKLPTNSFMGIHSGNELLNGVGLYKDWIKRAKYFGIKNLGICEKGSLRGVMSFQQQCIKNDIKPIFGMTIPISKGADDYEVKAYAKNFVGWQNLLKFSSILNVEENPTIQEEILEKYSEGLFIIADPKYTLYKNCPHFIKYYQLDTVIYSDVDIDMGYMNNLERYLKSDLHPVELCDAYYIEPEEWEVREKLWGIAKSFDFKSKNQYFKNTDQYAKELIRMFSPENKSWVKLFKEANKNLEHIVENCNFEYDTTSRHLPKYKMTPEESSRFKSNGELFLYLIKKGFKERKIEDASKYIERLKEEIDVLKSGDVIDYFLVTYDIIKFAKENDILVGLGRGSAGGSLVSYLLGIINVDPMEFGLLFSRFLNKGRMGKLEECSAFEIETTEGTIKLNEKSLLRIVRGKKEMPIFVEDLKEGDKILKY